LPPDLLEQIENRYYHLGEMLGGNFADAVLRVLEIPYQPADLLEQMVAPLLARLATLEAAPPPPEPEPETIRPHHPAEPNLLPPHIIAATRAAALPPTSHPRAGPDR
jgi:hypothetical protein